MKGVERPWFFLFIILESSLKMTQLDVELFVGKIEIATGTKALTTDNSTMRMAMQIHVSIL